MKGPISLTQIALLGVFPMALTPHTYAICALNEAV